MHRRTSKGADIVRAVTEVAVGEGVDLESFKAVLQTPEVRSACACFLSNWRRTGELMRALWGQGTSSSSMLTSSSSWTRKHASPRPTIAWDGQQGAYRSEEGLRQLLIRSWQPARHRYHLQDLLRQHDPHRYLDLPPSLCRRARLPPPRPSLRPLARPPPLLVCPAPPLFALLAAQSSDHRLLAMEPQGGSLCDAPPADRPAAQRVRRLRPREGGPDPARCGLWARAGDGEHGV